MQVVLAVSKVLTAPFFSDPITLNGDNFGTERERYVRKARNKIAISSSRNLSIWFQFFNVSRLCLKLQRFEKIRANNTFETDCAVTVNIKVSRGRIEEDNEVSLMALSAIWNDKIKVSEKRSGSPHPPVDFARCPQNRWLRGGSLPDKLWLSQFFRLRALADH